MTKLEQKIWEQFGKFIDDIYYDNEGECFGKAYGSKTWWIELKAGYECARFTIIHESTLSDCYRILKNHTIRKVD